ncbi:MAG: efflux RND transporter periplasmic adaptor subunit [Gemmatimonadaceae bacterium]|nr:efflux RND transporter periplasmic adaptor subunit [Gemmatimonadaceae bacterium]
MHKYLSYALLSATIATTACKSDAKSQLEAAEKAAAAGTIIGNENIAVAEVGPISTGPSISGALIPEREATVRAQLSGSVVRTYAEQGQAVRAGAVLARLDQAALQEPYLSARAGLASASNSNDIAQRELARSQKLLAAGAISERDIDVSRRNAIAARAALEDARARLATAQKQLGNATVTSPISGVVSERQASAGDVVQPGGALFSVVDPTSMRLEASVPADQLALVRVGVPVSFTINGYPDRQFLGRVTRINPTADPATRQVRIYVSIPNSGRTLVGGLFANGRIAATAHNGIAAPVSAVDMRGTVPTVVRIKNGKADRVQVQIGIRDEGSERIEILTGVQAGDTLLLGAAQGITPGTPVRVSNPNDKPIAAPAAEGAKQ